MAPKKDTEPTKIEPELTKIESELTKTSIEISTKSPAGSGAATNLKPDVELFFEKRLAVGTTEKVATETMLKVCL